MSWKDNLYLAALALLIVAIGAAFLAEIPVMQDRSHALWAITILSLVGVMTYLAAALTLQWSEIEPKLVAGISDYPRARAAG
jgi:hypothetical protein